MACAPHGGHHRDMQQTSTMTRRIGELTVSGLGFGCWAIAGAFGREGAAAGWGDVDDDESIAAIRRALELGVTFFDTADVYGTGHSERVLARALGRDRDGVAIATKFGNTFEDGTGRMTGTDASPAYIRRALAASLQRLRTDRIELYQCHLGDLERAQADEVAGTVEELRAEGLIGAYGWSLDDAERAAQWAGRDGCAAIQHHLNVLEDAPEMVALCERHGLASIDRAPLAMGLLSGKFDAASRLPRDDVRASGASWLTAFDPEGRPRRDFLERLAAVRELLTGDGRTLVQGALGWLWARSERTVPIPGFKTVAQAEENAGALAHGPLSSEEFAQVEKLLAAVREPGR